VPYEEAWALQRQLVAARAAGVGEDVLLLCEHEEVITTGRRAQTPDRDPAAELAGAHAAGIPVLTIERGGAATYHGPGQLVGYPIVRLADGERDLHAFLRAIEGALIEALERGGGLTPGRRDGFTGVWTGERKLASIGIACRRWVTYHGFALNLTTDLDRFRLFRPCDLDAQVMASLASLGAPADRATLSGDVHRALAGLLGRSPAEADPSAVRGWTA
jgi:lipoate-protein ligase B